MSAARAKGATPEPEFVCSSCGAEFDLAAGAARRCPSCLRSSGVVARATMEAAAPAASRTSRRGTVLLLVVGALAAGSAGAWWHLSQAPADAPAVADARSGAVEALPEDLRLDPAEVTPAVRLAADALPSSPAAIVEAVKAAAAAGRIPRRGLDDDWAGAPRSAAALAPALDGETTVPTAGSLAIGLLAVSLLDAKGLGPAQLGVDDGAPDAATELLARRYVLRVPGGPWLSTDDGAAPTGGDVRALDAGQLQANVLAWRALGAIAAEDLALAPRASQQAKALAPGDAAIAFVAGLVQVASGLADMGLSAMESAATLNADSRTWMVLGLTAMELSQPFKADQYLARAAEADAALVEPHVLMAQVDLERLGLVPKTQRDGVVEAIREHLAAAEAIQPDARGVRTIKAQLAALDDDLEGAQALLQEEVDAHKADPGAWMDLVRFLQASQREREALELLQRATGEAGLEDPDLLQALGVLLARDGRLSEAVGPLQRALAAAPERPDLRPQLAQLHKELGDPAKARGLLKEQLRLREDDRDARLLLAQLELDEGKLDAAAQQVERVLGAHASDADAAVLKLLIALKSGEQVEAARQAALDAVGSRSELGRVLLEQGFAAQGEALLEEAVDQEPEDGLAPVVLSALWVATGREADAVALREKVLGRVEDEAARDVLKQQFDAAFAQARAALEQQPTP